MPETTFAEWLKASRSRSGWNEQQLADNAGLSQPYINLLEDGARRPSRGAVEKLAAAMGIDSAPGLLAAGFVPPRGVLSEPETEFIPGGYRREILGYIAGQPIYFGIPADVVDEQELEDFRDAAKIILRRKGIQEFDASSGPISCQATNQ
jgi:transcriptional regulator with XRE-family HTH domain